MAVGLTKTKAARVATYAEKAPERGPFLREGRGKVVQETNRIVNGYW